MGRKLKVDMTDVESYTKCEEGEHVVKLVAVEEKVSSNGNDMLSMKYEVVSKGASQGATLYDNFTLTEKALWKLKAYLSCIGLKAEGRIQIDLDNLVGKRCIAVVEHEEYNGTERAKIKDFKKIQVEPEESDEDDFEEEEEAPKPKKDAKKAAPKKDAKKKPPVDEDEDDDWEDA
jgi:hypothetical protein